MTHVTYKLTARNRDQLRNPTLYAQLSSMGYLYLFSFHVVNNYSLQTCNSSHLVYLQDGMMFTYSSASQFTRVINGAL